MALEDYDSSNEIDNINITINYINTDFGIILLIKRKLSINIKTLF